MKRKSLRRAEEKPAPMRVKMPKNTVEYSQQCTETAERNFIDYDTWYKNFLALKERCKHFKFRQEVKELKAQEKESNSK